MAVAIQNSKIKIQSVQVTNTGRQWNWAKHGIGTAWQAMINWPGLLWGLWWGRVGTFEICKYSDNPIMYITL